MLTNRVTLVFLLVFAACTTPHTTNAQRPDFKIPKWAIGRYWSVSSDAPIRSVVIKDQTMIETSKLLQDFIGYVENAILDGLSRKERADGDQPLRPCSYEEKPWRNAISTNFGLRGWPEVEHECITEFVGTRIDKDQEPNFTVKEVYDAVVRRGRAGQKLANEVWDVAVGNRTAPGREPLQPDFIVETEHITAFQKCNLTAVAAARVGPLWNIKFGFTNEPKLVMLPNFARQSVIEHLHVAENGSFAWPMLKNMSERNDESIGRINKTVENSTTLIASFRGDAGQSHYGTVYIDENPAIKDALDKSDLWIQQAQDALAPSSIAILVLPLLLAVVPIALVADVSTTVMFLYTFISDILAAVPLGIKGIELNFIGSRRVQSTVMRITSGGNSTKMNTSGAELWVAQCETNSRIQAVGIVFIVLAIVFMIVGVTLEFLARRFVKHERRKRVIHMEGMRLDQEAARSVGANNEFSSLINSGDGQMGQGQPRRRIVPISDEKATGEDDAVVATARGE